MIKRVDELLLLFSGQPEVTEMLLESEKCYKVEAFRAALLFAYNAFIRAVRDRLIRFGSPENVGSDEWGAFKKRLLNDDASEKAVFEAITGQHQKYLDIKENLKTQIQYWRDRRNACAHWKDEVVNVSKIDEFYLFILQNYRKCTRFLPEETVYNDMFSDRKDEEFTADYLETSVKMLPYVLDEKDLPRFYRRLFSEIHNHRFEDGILERHVELLNNIMMLCVPEYVNPLLDELKRDVVAMAELIKRHPASGGCFWRTSEEFSSFFLSPALDVQVRVQVASALMSCGTLTDEMFDVAYERIERDAECRLEGCTNEFLHRISSRLIKKIKSRPDWYGRGYSYGYVNNRSDFFYQMLLASDSIPDVIECLKILFSGDTYSFSLFNMFKRANDEARSFNERILEHAAPDCADIPPKILTEILQNRLDAS